ncbi:SymE family type I addiction module toxin [Collimonas sp.]
MRLHGSGLKQAGFMPNVPVRVRVMKGCLMITSD